MKVIILVVKSHSRRDGTEMCGHPVYHGSPTAPAEPSRAAPPPDAAPSPQRTRVAGGDPGLPSYHVSRRSVAEA